MLTQNHDMPRGKANGTRAVVKQVALKSEKSPTVVTLSPGVRAWAAARAGQVDKILLHHLNDRVQPPAFNVQPKQFSFRASLPTPAALLPSEYDQDVVRMTAMQLPFVSNSATTGHKLQGCSVDFFSALKRLLPVPMLTICSSLALSSLLLPAKGPLLLLTALLLVD